MNVPYDTVTADTAYKEALLDHYRRPRNKADTGDAQVVARGRNPRCGDDLEVGVDFDGDSLNRVRFRGRGCSICIASASMMTEAVTGRSRDEVNRLSTLVSDWLSNTADDAEVPELLRPLSPIRSLPARRRCVMLAWEALHEALAARAEAT